MTEKLTTRLFNNSRFYIVSGSVLLSILVICVLRIAIIDPRLRGIRLQQIFGLISVVYWYMVLVISAAAKVMPKKSWMGYILFMRRAFGAMVAYFALFHTLVAFFDQLEGWRGIGLLPPIFRWSLVLGTLALVVLLIMALLSVDKVVSLTKFRYWKVLQRLSYIAGLLVIVHVWIIGTHAAPVLVQLISFQALALLFALEAWRIGLGMAAKGKKPARVVVSSILLWVMLTGSLALMRLIVPSYTKSHHAREAQETTIHAH